MGVEEFAHHSLGDNHVRLQVGQEIDLPDEDQVVQWRGVGNCEHYNPS